MLEKMREAEKEGKGEMMTQWAVAAWGWLADRCLQARRGGALLEYALVLAFVAAAVTGALHVLQPAISSTLDTIANSL